MRSTHLKIPSARKCHVPRLRWFPLSQSRSLWMQSSLSTSRQEQRETTLMIMNSIRSNKSSESSIKGLMRDINRSGTTRRRSRRLRTGKAWLILSKEDWVVVRLRCKIWVHQRKRLRRDWTSKCSVLVTLNFLVARPKRTRKRARARNQRPRVESELYRFRNRSGRWSNYGSFWEMGAWVRIR